MDMTRRYARWHDLSMDRPRWLRPRSGRRRSFRTPSATAPAAPIPSDPDAPGDPATVRRVEFLDPTIGGLLATDGYARLGPFLDAGEVQRANDVFAEAQRRLGTPLPDHWYPTILLPDDAVRDFITAELRSLVEPRLLRLVDDAALDVVRLDYSVKPPSPNTGLGPHQDFALVDESSAQSLYLWIPLCDMDESNGTLHVLPGSHRFSNRIRSRHVPSVFDDVLPDIREASTRLDVKAGELIVMVSGVIHWSPPNRSDSLRLAAHGIVTPPGVPLVFYFRDDDTPDDLVECFELDIDQYVRAIHHGRPSDVPLDHMEPLPPSNMNRARFERGMATFGPRNAS